MERMEAMGKGTGRLYDLIGLSSYLWGMGKPGSKTRGVKRMTQVAALLNIQVREGGRRLYEARVKGAGQGTKGVRDAFIVADKALKS